MKKNIRLTIHNKRTGENYNPRTNTITQAINGREKDDWLNAVVGLAVKHWFNTDSYFWYENVSGTISGEARPSDTNPRPRFFVFDVNANGKAIGTSLQFLMVIE